MDTINVKICLGTTCYVMGSSNLQSLFDQLPSKLAEHVSIEGATCLGYCKDQKFGKAPYVCIGEEVMAEATVEKVIKKLEELTAAGD